MAATKEGNSAFNNLLIAVQKKYNDPRAGISFSGRKVKVCVCVVRIHVKFNLSFKLKPKVGMHVKYK